MKKVLFLILPGVFLTLVLSGCHKQNAEHTVSPAPPVPPAVTVPEKPRSQAVIYVIDPKASGDQDSLKPRTVRLADPQSPARETINALLHAANSPIPAGTALRGITIENGVATLDFSRSPVNETGGEGPQGDAMTALARTLGQFPEVSRFQIQVKGQPVTTFGEMTTDGPMDVVRPEAVRQARGAGAGAQ